MLLKSHEVILPCDPSSSASPYDSFKNSLTSWQHVKTPSRCLRRIKPGRLCQGRRIQTYRVFVNGMPLLLPINVGMLVQNQQLSGVSQLPDDILLKDVSISNSYKLVGVTYGNGNHFKSAMRLPGQITANPGWYEYDGLWENRQKGTGLHYSSKTPETPRGYTMSYALYFRQ